MNFQIHHRPSYALLEVELGPQQTLVSESGAMVAKSNHIKIEPKLTIDPNPSAADKFSKILIAGIRKLLGGESFFVSHFTTNEPGKVLLAPTLDGDIVHYKLNNSKLFLSGTAYLASIGNIDVGIKWGGISGLLAKNGLFHLEVSGTGDLWFNSFGGIETIEVDGEYIVDNGHLVAWDSTLTYSMSRSGSGLMSLVASGEGIVCRFKGKGRVFIQTRNLESFGEWISAHF